MQNVDWLLTGQPREGQVEALLRSYTGYSYRDHRHAEWHQEALPHVGGVAKGWGHFMQMRVGKTPVALNEYMLLKRDHNIRRMLVLSPNKFKFTWAKEAMRFGVDVEPFVHDVDKGPTVRWMEKNQDEGILIINYESLIHNLFPTYLANWLGSNALIVADESVKIKNPTATSFKTALQLGKGVEYTRALTGKPAPQSAHDYYAQLRFCKALEGIVAPQWKARHCETGGFKGKQILGVKNPDRLVKTLRDHAFIARRADWADAIASDYNTVDLEMLPEQIEAYKSMEKDFVMWLTSGEIISAGAAAAKYSKMQQISSGFIYNDEGEERTIVDFEKTFKARHLAEHVEEGVVDKVIVFYYHRPLCDRLMSLLSKYNPALIASESVMKQKGLNTEAEKERFNNDPNCKVLIGQQTAIKYGHTLMGSKENPCLDLVYFENSYSLDDRAQTEERPQGDGQQAALQILDYASTSIERRVIQNLQRKEAVYSLIVDHYLRRS